MQARESSPVGDRHSTTELHHYMYTTESVTHGQCDARPTITFPAIEHHHRLAGIKLYLFGDRGMCVCVCEQLAQSHYMKVEWPTVKV